MFMKHILMIILGGMVLGLSSCKKEQKTYYGPGGLQGFAQKEMSVDVDANNSEFDVPIIYTEPHSVSYQNLAFSIDPASTAQRAVQFDMPTATITSYNPLYFSAAVLGSNDGLKGSFPIITYPDKITEPIVLILNAVNGPDATPVEGCNPQLTIRLNPAQ